ncbi:hypothetical protein C8Q73DRAFT_662608 [Cubamyces lactineus]|nr:hypothetical protein C8Q73DRAFT_662608 [Cubamyces lactineus]
MNQNEASSSQFGYEDHFTPARTRKKRKNRPQAAPPSLTVLLDRASEELAHGDWLRETQQSLRESLEEAFPASDAAPSVLCLGLGSPASSRDARAQLAFLLAACDDLSIDRTNVAAFDPVFAPQDLELLAQLRLTALPDNRQASYELRSPTIVFMPHCDLHLYENLLRENWSPAQLPNVLLIANRLCDYAEKKLASEHPCVARLAPYLTSRPLRPSTAFPTAFNNTSIQFVRASSLAERGADWWTLPDVAATSASTGQSARTPAPGPEQTTEDVKLSRGVTDVSGEPKGPREERRAPGSAPARAQVRSNGDEVAVTRGVQVADRDHGADGADGARAPSASSPSRDQ